MSELLIKISTGIAVIIGVGMFIVLAMIINPEIKEGIISSPSEKTK